MVGAIRQRLVILGCGDFGLSAVAHLHGRGLGARTDISLLTVGGAARTRQQGLELLRQKVAGGWREWQAVFGPGTPPPRIALIGAAGEPGGGGALIAALTSLERQAPGSRRTVWLALPDGAVGAAERARAFATLLELEALRRMAAWERTHLYEVGPEQRELPPMFAEAALLWGLRPGDSLPGTGGAAYAGFGLGDVRDLRPLLIDQLAPLVARQTLELWSGGSGVAPDGVTEAPDGVPDDLDRLTGALLTDLYPRDLTNRRWSTLEEYNRFRRHCQDERQTAGQLAAHADRYLAAARAFYQPLHWARWYENARTHWQLAAVRLRDEILARWAASRTERDETACRSLRTRVNRLAQQLQAERTAQEKARAEYQFAADVATEKLKDTLTARGAAASGRAARRPDGQRNTRLDGEQRQRLVRMMELVDQHLSGRTFEEGRIAALTWLLAELALVQDEMAGLLAEFDQRRTQAAGLLPRLATRAASQHVVSAPHMLPPLIAPDRLSALLPRVTPRQVMRVLQRGPAGDPPRWLSQLDEAARQDVAATLESGADLRLAVPRGNPVREAWWRLIMPHLQAPGAPVRLQASDRLPEEYREEAARRLGVRPELAPEDWFPGEGFLYLEQAGLTDLRQVQSLAPLWEGYRQMVPEEQQALLVLPEPAGGWPDLRPPLRLAREQQIEAALVLVRALLLGLITPTGRRERLLARYLSPDGTSVLLRPFADRTDALQAMTADDTLQSGLARLTDRWLARLQPRQMAGYYALLFHARQNSPPQGEEEPLWQAAFAREMERLLHQLSAAGREWELMAGAMALAVGTPQDQFSLGAGPWRYLKW